MKCPNDDETLVLSERQGIEIDYCPRCRGVWLDRGELDKLIERGVDGYGPESARRSYDDRGGDDRRGRDDDDDRPRHGGKRKKKGFLSEMFEFGE